MHTVIEVRGLSKSYGERRVLALDNVSFSVKKGEFTAIMGSSGSGKTTLMSILGCLDRQSDGVYMLDGRQPAEMSDRELSRVRNEKIGFVFQGFNLIPSLTALENAALPLFYRGCSAQKRRKAAMDALERVGLADRAAHRPSELSGGQQQRVAIARAVAAQPAIILADEPTGNLDSRTESDIMEIFRGLNEAGSTVVLITHDLSVAGYAGRLLRLHDGKLDGDAVY